MPGTANFWAVLTDVGTIDGQLVDIPLGGEPYKIYGAGGTTSLLAEGTTDPEGIIDVSVGATYKEIDVWAGAPLTKILDDYQF